MSAQRKKPVARRLLLFSLLAALVAAVWRRLARRPRYLEATPADPE